MTSRFVKAATRRQALCWPSARLSIQSVGQAEKFVPISKTWRLAGIWSAPFSPTPTRTRCDAAARADDGPQLVDELTGATICRSVPKPDNRRVTPSPSPRPRHPEAVASRRPIIGAGVAGRYPMRRAVLGLPFLLICVHPACLFRYAGACGVVAKPCCKPAKLN